MRLPPPTPARVGMAAAGEAVRLKGKLRKEGKPGLFSSKGGINTRFFDLDEEFLCYYQNTASADFVPSETIELRHVSEVCSILDRYEGEACFQVVTPKRTFFLIAADDAEREQWVQGILHNVTLRRCRV